MLPLIEMVLETQVIHDEFEEGVKEAKERAKEEKERAKTIREQWEMKKKTNNPVRPLFFCSDGQFEMCVLGRTRRPEQSTNEP
jgi:hypothetical protein